MEDQAPITPAPDLTRGLRSMITSAKAGVLAVLLTASVIEFSSAADFCVADKLCFEKRYIWGIIIGGATTFLALLRLVLLKFAPVLPGVVDLVLAIILCGGWVFGAAFNTQDGGIFETTDNGYFATWICLFASGYYLSMSFATITERALTEVKQFNTGLSVCLVASIIEMSVAAEICSRSQKITDCDKKIAFAVVVGALTTFICLITVCVLKFKGDAASGAAKYISILLVVLWAVGAAVNTSKTGPFKDTNSANGYFSTWIAFFAALVFFSSSFFPDEHLAQPVPTSNPNEGPGY